MNARLAALHVYPIKSCAGIALSSARVEATGLAHDRRWMLVRPNGRFVTQRELPRMALIATALEGGTLALSAPGMASLAVPCASPGESRAVNVWKFDGRGIDAGDAVAEWFTHFLDTPLRLVRFDPDAPRVVSPEWTPGVTAHTLFADGFPLLVIARASLDDLNARLPKPLPMERFRPNLVLEGVGAYDEDRIAEIDVGAVTVRLVKPCARCSITTTDQATGARDGDEPLATLRKYRYDRELLGVMFGWNAIVVRGAGERIDAGAACAIRIRPPA